MNCRCFGLRMTVESIMCFCYGHKLITISTALDHETNSTTLYSTQTRLNRHSASDDKARYFAQWIRNWSWKCLNLLLWSVLSSNLQWTSLWSLEQQGLKSFQLFNNSVWLLLTLTTVKFKNKDITWAHIIYFIHTCDNYYNE